MAVNLSPVGGVAAQFFDNNGVILSGGKLYTYAAGTTTPQTTYTTSAGNIAHTNPIILDSAGRVPGGEVWLTNAVSYKFVLNTSTNVLIGAYDNITGSSSGIGTSLASSSGSSLIGYLPSGTGAITTTVQSKLRETVSVFDFMTAAQIADVQSGTATLDVTAAIQNAVNSSAGKALYFPGGTYLVSNVITLISNSVLYGDVGVSILKLKSQTYASANVSIFVITNINNVYIYGLTFNGNKGNIGTTRNPINTVYQSTKITFNTCEWVNCEGICLNVSTAIDSFAVLYCRFINCGGATDNSDGYRRQAIAFSSSPLIRSKDVKIVGNYFFAQGLDCISMTNLDDVLVSNNSAYNSYSFLYNNPSPYTTVNLTVTGNVIYNTNQGSLVNTVNPNAIDLPSVTNGTITGNSIYRCEQSGIGIFKGSSNIVVSSNSLVDCGYKGVSWYGGISVGGDGLSASNISQVVVTNNTITSTGAVAAMKFGILLSSDLTGVTIIDNNLINYVTSKYGYYLYTTVPGSTNVFALTDNSFISATTLINDFDTTNQSITNWRKVNTLTGYYFNGIKVVGIQQAAIANSGNATTDAILAALRTHGLIAT